MACHPSGISVDIVGIEASDRGRSCEKHTCCGSLLSPDVVVRFRAIQLEKEDEGDGVVETTAIAVFHVTGGIDWISGSGEPFEKECIFSCGAENCHTSLPGW